MFGIIAYLCVAGAVTVFVGVGYYLVEKFSEPKPREDLYDYLQKRGY